MDTQQVLSSLASLRDNLSAIETARQQVQNNVAAYDKVRQQLADTSTNISKILEDFTALTQEIEGYQASISSDVKATTDDILKALKKKAETISNESANVVDSLKQALISVQNELKIATDDAVKRIDENTLKTNQDLDVLLKQTNADFVSSTESIVKSFAKEIDNFQKQISQISDKFDKGLTAQLGRFATSVNEHIGKYESLNDALRNQIDTFNGQNELLKDSIARLESSISEKIGEILPALTASIDGIGSVISNSKEELESGLDSTYQKIKTDLKGSHDATKKRIEKIEDKMASNQSKTSAGIDLIIKSVQEQMDEVKSQNQSNRTMMIAGFIILALPILIILARMLKFI